MGKGFCCGKLHGHGVQLNASPLYIPKIQSEQSDIVTTLSFSVSAV